ncbi:MAG: nucleotidyltransferase domain-containing protein [Calditrichaeota bacterium]|nr:MAG: nucleotidyltransferase domain-containing protein [Calditrichota bacterium]
MVSQLDLASLKQALEAEKKVLAAYLFGSHATGEAGPLSDVDIAVYSDGPLALEDRLGIIQRVSKKARLENLDITFLDRLENLFILKDIITRGVVLVDKDPDRREYFEVMAHHRYLDFIYQRKLFIGE